MCRLQRSHPFFRMLIVGILAGSGTFPVHAEEPTKEVVKTTAPDVPSNPIRLILPPVVHAVPGIETNLYFDNLCLVVNPANFVFDPNCGKGRHQRERWTWTPSEQDVGDHAWSISVRNDQNQVIAKAETIIRVIDPKAGEGKVLSLLCIGDSLTNASLYPEQILNHCKLPGNPQLELIGSNWVTPQPGPVRHEGYGGWTALRFATHYTETARTGETSKRGSPFLYLQPDGTKKLDFQHYCHDVSNGKMPTHVTIFLGPNDVFSLNDETLEPGVDAILKHFDQLVVMIRTASPTTRIGIMLPVPPAATQDAFGANYASGQTRWQYKRNQHRLLEKMHAKYGGRESDQIDLISTYVNLDCDHNYPTEQVAPNARATGSIARLNNGVHPSGAGYSQIADSVYGWLKATAK